MALVPEWGLAVAFVDGQRTPAEVDLLLERVAYVTTDLIPFFYQRPMAGILHRVAACVWNMISATTVWHAWPTPSSTVRSPQRVELCPSGQDV